MLAGSINRNLKSLSEFMEIDKSQGVEFSMIVSALFC